MDKTITTSIKRRNWPKIIRKVGILFFLLALLIPASFSGGSYPGAGMSALVVTPAWAFVAMANGIQSELWKEWLLGILMLVGWSSNFFIFFKIWPKLVPLVIALPWVLFIGATFLDNSLTGISTIAIDYVPFYPWAASIALIHVSRLTEPKPMPEKRTMWTGF